MNEIATLEVSVMEQTIETHDQDAETRIRKEIERQRFYAAHNRASAIAHARRVELKKWQGVFAEIDAIIAELKAKPKLEKNK